MTSRLRAALVVAVLAAPAGARAAAWTQPEGQGLFIGTATLTSAEHQFQEGRAVRRPDYTKTETTFLLEYGLTGRLTLIAQPSIRTTRIGGASGDDFAGLGYTDLGARWRLWQGAGGVFSVQGLLRLPGATDARRAAQIGHTGAEIDLRALFGQGFALGGRPAFVNVEAAYRLRLGDAPDEYRVDVTFGLRPAPRWLLLAQNFAVASNGSGRGPFAAYWYTRAQVSAVYELGGGWSVQAGAARVYAGDNMLRETNAILALWRRF